MDIARLAGTPGFFPALLRHLRAEGDVASLPLETTIIQSILLCIIAGNKHLILRTPAEDVALVVKLAVWTLSSIFDLATHKQKIRSRASSQGTHAPSPAAFLRSLFLPPSTLSNQVSQDESSPEVVVAQGRLNKGSNRSRSRTRSTLKAKLKSSRYSHSVSHPTEFAVVDARHVSGADSPSDYFASASYKTSDILSGESTGDPSLPSPSCSLQAASVSNRLPQNAFKRSNLELPQALVVSGLEYASGASQSELVRVLAERRLVVDSLPKKLCNREDNEDQDISENEEDGVWQLPELFIMVYVCPVNSKERPAIHKSLLDRFAMSSNIYVSQSVRHALRSPIFSPAQSSSQSQLSFHSNQSTPLLAQSKVLPQCTTSSYSRKVSSSRPPPSFSTAMTGPLLIRLRHIFSNTQLSPRSSLFVYDLLSATRHHPLLDATLLTARATKDAEELARAWRVLGGDLTGCEVIRPSTDIRMLQERLRNEEICHDDAPASEAHRSGNLDNLPHLEVFEADIARVVPRVVSHRVCLREGPSDEVLSSAVFGATFSKDGAGTSYDADKTVKGVIVQILSDV